MNKAQIKIFNQRLDAIMKQVAKTRDALDELISDASELADDCVAALESLDDARDHLSKMV